MRSSWMTPPTSCGWRRSSTNRASSACCGWWRPPPAASGAGNRCAKGWPACGVWRFAQVGRAAHHRYLDALALAQPTGKALAQLDRLCQPHTQPGQRHARFQPVAAPDAALFAAVLAGEHARNGFRNRDLQTRLFPKPPADAAEYRRRSAQVTRQLAKRRGHGLIAKVPRCRLYRLTATGTQLMSAALHYRHDFPAAFHAAAT